MDWQSDPQLRAIRQEFIESLPDRRSQIEHALELLRAESNSKRRSEHAQAIAFVAHKLAGTAGSYGLQDLTDRAALVEDHVESENFEDLVEKLIEAICSAEIAPSESKP